MGTIATAFTTAFRDYNTDGNAASGIKQPSKSEIRSIGTTIEAYFAAPWTLSANVTVTTPPAAPAGYVAQYIGASANSNQFVLMDGYSGIPGFRTRRANVTSSAASAVLSGETISTWDVYGYGATGFSGGARCQIRAVATQNWTDTNQGCKFVIATTANNGTTLTDRVTIDQDGTVSVVGAATIGGTLTTSAALLAAGSLRYTGLQYSTATSGTVTLSASTPVLIHEPGTTVSTLTIAFPASPVDGQIQIINFVSAVTTLTWTPSAGTTIAVAPGSPTQNSVFTFIYRVANTKWYRI